MTHGRAYMVETGRCSPPCGPCANALREARRRKKQRVVAGRVDTLLRPDWSRALVRELVDRYGYSYTVLAEATELSKRRIKVLYRSDFEVQHVRTSTQLRIERAYSLRDTTAARYRNRRAATLARAAVRALMLQGYDQRTIAERVGASRNVISNLGVARTRYVDRWLEDKLVVLTREVGALPGPSPRTAARARKLGYRPAAANDRLL